MSRKLTAAQQAALDALPPKRRAFVLAYVGEAQGNQTRAAEIAGYAGPTVEGSRLMTFDKVRDAIATLRGPTEAAAVDRVEQWRDAVAKWALEGYRIVKLPGHDPIEEPLEAKEQAKAFDMLGKSLGIYSEKRTVNGTLTLEMLLEKMPFLAREKIRQRREREGSEEQEGSDDGNDDTEGADSEG